MSYKIDNDISNTITNMDWKFLIILDACRYDYFEETYKEIFGTYGNLKKATVTSSWTLQYLNNEFDNKRFVDIVYISSCPFITSKEKPITYTQEHGETLEFCGKNHFLKVVDVWDFGWNDKIGTVPSWEVNKTFHKEYLKRPEKRFILHYMHPHPPFVTIGGEPIIKKNDDGIAVKRRYLSERQSWAIKKILKIKPTMNIEKLYMEKGKDGLIEAYKDEIRDVLKTVQPLIESIRGKWVITSDHGEHICSFWRCKQGHGGKLDRYLSEVPYFTIDGGYI